MIDFQNVQHIMQRINEIEERFGLMQQNAAARVQGPTFQEALSKEMDKGKTNPAPAKIGSDAASNKKTAASPGGDTAQMIEEAALKYNVNPRLVSAVAETESNFNQGAVSDAGAVGIMQLMPQTAAGLGVNPYDKQQNIEGGAKYLKQMLDTFGGDVRKAVAAYNAGAQAVKEYNGVPPYKETQNYVDKVLDLYQ